MNDMITDRPNSNTFYNYTDLNRVEAKTKELAEILTSKGYYVTVVTKTDWKETDFPTVSQMNRYLDSIKKLATQFYKESGKYLPVTMRRLNYIGANEIEKCLVYIESLIDEMTRYYRQCNTFYCGAW